MNRVTKLPAERREEIIAASRKLFAEKGFLGTKVSDIVQEVGVSQGTFYNYFKSKEEIVDAIVDGYVGEIVRAILPVMGDRRWNAIEKLERMAECQLQVNRRANPGIHSIKGIDIHEKIVGQIVRKLVPLQAEVFQQGVREGLFSASQVRELTEVFVVAAHILFDPGIFDWTMDELSRRIDFMTRLMDACFGAPEGSFRFYRRLMSGGRIAP